MGLNLACIVHHLSCVDRVRHSDSIPTALSPSAFGSDHTSEPCSPLPGEAGSSVSLSSSAATDGGGAARVTSDVAPAVGTGVAANADVATITVAATAPKREGLAAAILLPPTRHDTL